MGSTTVGIVGGSGYIGSSLTNYLSQKYSIHVIDQKKPPYQLNSNCSFVPCDITNFDKVTQALSDVDFVLHSAIIQIPLINEQKRLAYGVNYIGTQNVCKVVDSNPQIKGMIMTGTWHTIGERELKGNIDEEFGFRPDKVESRARLYALSKMAQEAMVRFYDEMSDKIFGVIRMGTVLGVGMPEKTAANIFIERGLKGQSITPYQSSMYRPMLYVDIDDIRKAFDLYLEKIFNGKIGKSDNSLSHIVNVYYPEPITILELAKITKVKIEQLSGGRISPPIEIVQDPNPSLFNENDKYEMKVNCEKAKTLLGLKKITSPEKSIEKLIKIKMNLS
ncbi:MAG: NAD(P)-dependent oxidoreductase [Candidatus Bathyarchaeota archaeon]|nr:NAD(P)-dependent oxidoreductase [Candidatus Bathyarchaeota archaeon]